MPKKPENYYRPSTLAEALRILSLPNTAPLAGGTKLLATESGVSLAGVVDLQDLGLDNLQFKEANLAMGATATLTSVSEFLTKEAAKNVQAQFLCKAIKRAGPNTYRNAATVGGIIASRLPDSEFLAALLVLDALLTVQKDRIEQIPLREYLAADEEPEGLIIEVTIPWIDGQGGSERVARTPADYPIVSITAWWPGDESPRLAATGIGIRPMRLTASEGQLAQGQNPQTIEAAAMEAKKANTHPGDFRGDAAYRAEMAAVLTRRVLQAGDLPADPH